MDYDFSYYGSGLSRYKSIPYLTTITVSGRVFITCLFIEIINSFRLMITRVNLVLGQDLLDISKVATLGASVVRLSVLAEVLDRILEYQDQKASII